VIGQKNVVALLCACCLLTGIFLWDVDIAHSQMIIQAAGQKNIVLSGLIFKNADPNAVYHAGLAGMVGVVLILVCIIIELEFRD
jgi:hypothetical protein